MMDMHSPHRSFPRNTESSSSSFNGGGSSRSLFDKSNNNGSSQTITQSPLILGKSIDNGDDSVRKRRTALSTQRSQSVSVISSEKEALANARSLLRKTASRRDVDHHHQQDDYDWKKDQDVDIVPKGSPSVRSKSLLELSMQSPTTRMKEKEKTKRASKSSDEYEPTKEERKKIKKKQKKSAIKIQAMVRGYIYWKRM
jgi:hypothetical protein